LRISDWHEAKALDTMMSTYLFVATRAINTAISTALTAWASAIGIRIRLART
jgi:hypothetical protein